MARNVKKGTHLEDQLSYYQEQTSKRRTESALFFIGGIICGMVGITSSAPFFLGVSAFLIVISIALFSNNSEKNETDILKSGIQGERSANRCVMLLPESYTIFENLTVSYNNEQKEIDMLVVGPTGIFIIETKNVRGSICGDINDMHWTQYKLSRNGSLFTNKLNNPVKQVNTQVYITAKYLKKHGIYTYINAIVYFSNTEASAELSNVDSKTQIFFARNDGANRMLDFILSNNQRLSQSECDKITKLLQRT